MSKLKFEDHQQHIHHMIEAALTAVNPYTITANALVNLPLHLNKGRLLLIAIGKAAVPMATAVSDKLDAQISSGIAITKKGQTEQVPSDKIETLFTAHPVPDQSSQLAAEKVFQLLQQTTADDTVLFLISGGASALCTQPLIRFDKWQALSKALLASGCPIQEFNTVRKQLDAVKGGGLARAAAPATCLTLILSDVIGNPVDMIGSGPTVPNSTTPQDALAILEKYQIDNAAAKRVLDELAKEPVAPQLESNYQIIGDLRLAAETAVQQAQALGFNSELRSTTLDGEASLAGIMAANLAKSAPPNSCIIMGGETTVTLKGDGIGGRNQELALAAAIELAETTNIVIATYATDGDDGPTEAAGAIVTGQTVAQAIKKGLIAQPFLNRNDSYTFFKQLGNHLIITGQTGTNVNDLLFICTYER